MTAIFTATLPGSNRGVRPRRGERDYAPFPLREPRGRIPRVDDHPRKSHYTLIIDGRVIGDDDDRVRAADLLVGEIHTLVVVTILTELGHVRIVVRDLRTLIFQQSDHVERGTLAHVVDVTLVGHAENENPAAVDRLLL